MSEMFAFMEEEKPEVSPLEQTSSEIIHEAEERLKSPRLMKIILEDVQTIGIAGEEKLALTLYLAMTSRRLDRPLAIIVQGPSSSGKSFVIDKIASLCPAEELFKATDITPNALYYVEPGSLSHKFVIAGERTHKQNQESSQITKAFREMVSAGELSKAVTIRDTQTGELLTKLIRQVGPIAYAESTTENEIFKEDLNRCILLHTDERSKQTRKIIEQEAKRFAGVVDYSQREHIVLLHHTMQRMLKPVVVVIPFAQALEQAFPSDRLEARRIFTHILSVIAACAFLHQYQRPLDEQGAILAHLDDYAVVRKLLEKPIAQSLGGALSEAVERFYYERLCPLDEAEYTAKQLAKKFGVDPHTVRNHLKVLLDVEAVEMTEPSRGPIPAKWKVKRGVNLDEGIENLLPTVAEVVEKQEMTEKEEDTDLSEVPF